MADHEPVPEDSQPLDPAAPLQRIERLESLVAALTTERTVSQPLPAPTPPIAQTPHPAPRSQSLESQFGTRVLSKVAVVLLLMLLAATVLKAFAYDMRNLGTGYRVISYLGLGIVLMAVSFAYQKDWLNLKETNPGDYPSHHPHEAAP